MSATDVFMPGVVKTALPIELAEEIIKEAWLGCSSPERWELYSTLCLVSRGWHNITLDICLRFVIIDVTADVEGYTKLSALAAALHDASSSVLSEAHRPSKRSPHLCLTVAKCFRQHNFYTDEDWAEFFSVIPSFVPDCTSVHIALSLDDSFDEGRWKGMLRMLAGMRIKSLYLTWAYDAEGCVTPRIVLPTVTYLRVQYYPRCACPTASSDTHETGCLSDNLLSFFPNLRHLHLDTPFFLKHLRCPTVQTLTLDALPSRLIPSRDPISSLVGWNIGAALNRGFLGGGETSTSRRIVVNTGMKIPTGWTQAQSACDAHGVTLERRCVFEDDPCPSYDDNQRKLLGSGLAAGFHRRS